MTSGASRPRGLAASLLVTTCILHRNYDVGQCVRAMARHGAGANTAGHAGRGSAASREIDMTLRIHTGAALAAMAVLAAAAPLSARAQPEPSLAEVPLPRLQAMVLPCDLRPPAGQVQTPATAFCAAAADELRRRAFDGNRERLLAWWLQARAAHGAASATVPVQPARRPTSQATPAQLRAAYLQCNRLAETTLLDFGTAAACSLVYEELKARVFGGDFQRLLAWSREQQPAGVAAVAGGGKGETAPR
jgi:hypothetical protein